MLKAEEAAKYLYVHVETIRRLARKGEIPAMKVGRGWRFKESELTHWAKTHHLRSRGTHILVVDDEAIIHKSIKHIFRDKPYRISSATDGEKAIELIKSDPPDVVFLDLNMPKMNGPSTLKEIRKLENGLPVVIITGFSDSNLMMEVARISPVLVVQKPVDPDKVIAAVELALNGSRSRRDFRKRL